MRRTRRRAQFSSAIPLVKHLDAFYDVLLRVEEASRVVAPAEQITALQDALLRVSHARIAYDDVLEALALSQEKQVADLQSAVRAEQANVKDTQHQVELAKASDEGRAVQAGHGGAPEAADTAAAKKPEEVKKPAATQTTQPGQTPQKPQ